MKITNQDIVKELQKRAGVISEDVLRIMKKMFSKNPAPNSTFTDKYGNNDGERYW